MFRCYDNNSNPLSNVELKARDIPENHVANYLVTALFDGSFVITSYDSSSYALDRNDFEESEIIIQKYNPHLQNQENNTQNNIKLTKSGTASILSWTYATVPRKEGGFLTLWTEDNKIFFQDFDNNCQPLGEATYQENSIPSEEGYITEHISISAILLGNGNVAVASRSLFRPYSGGSFFDEDYYKVMEIYNKDYERISEERISGLWNDYLSINSLSDDVFILFVLNYDNIIGRIYDKNGIVQGTPFQISVSGLSALKTSISSSPGGFVVAWAAAHEIFSEKYDDIVNDIVKLISESPSPSPSSEASLSSTASPSPSSEASLSSTASPSPSSSEASLSSTASPSPSSKMDSTKSDSHISDTIAGALGSGAVLGFIITSFMCYYHNKRRQEKTAPLGNNHNSSHGTRDEKKESKAFCGDMELGTIQNQREESNPSSHHNQTSVKSDETDNSSYSVSDKEEEIKPLRNKKEQETVPNQREKTEHLPDDDSINYRIARNLPLGHFFEEKDMKSNDSTEDELLIEMGKDLPLGYVMEEGNNSEINGESLSPTPSPTANSSRRINDSPSNSKGKY